MSRALRLDVAQTQCHGVRGELRCPDAADVDDNGRLEITDPIGLLGYLFLSNEAPVPVICAPDATEDPLGDCSGPGC